MKNSNVLKDSTLLNSDINPKDCQFCVYNCDNGCPCDQSKCWCCKDKSEFKLVSWLEGLESKKFKTFSHLAPFGENFSKVKPLLSVLTDLSISLVFCSDPAVLDPLCRAYKSLSSYINTLSNE